MDFATTLAELTGSWTGGYRMRMMPDDPYMAETAATATVNLAANGNMATVAYTWLNEDEPQDGLIVYGYDEQGGLRAVWGDSWHQGPQWMECRGSVGGNGVLTVLGAYAEDASWRIHLDPTDPEELRVTMDNIMPGMDYRVVELAFKRV